jgi:hypothetical protein
LSSWGDYGDIDRHSCEGRNPENSLPAELDARLREHDKKIPSPSINQNQLFSVFVKRALSSDRILSGETGNSLILIPVAS